MRKTRQPNHGQSPQENEGKEAFEWGRKRGEGLNPLKRKGRGKEGLRKQKCGDGNG